MHGIFMKRTIYITMGCLAAAVILAFAGFTLWKKTEPAERQVSQTAKPVPAPVAEPLPALPPEPETELVPPAPAPKLTKTSPVPAPVAVPEETATISEENTFYENLVKSSFPVYTVQTYDPDNPSTGLAPAKGEIWVRIKPGSAKEMNVLMAEMADLYRDIAGDSAGEEVVVVNWVGARPYARRVFTPEAPGSGS